MTNDIYLDDSFNSFINPNGNNPVLLQFSNTSAFIRGVTVLNQSNIPINLYINRLPQGLPDIPVAPGTFIGAPIPTAKYVWVAFGSASGAAPNGSIYCHYTTQLIVSTGGQIAGSTSGAGIFDQSTFDNTTFN